VIIYNLGIWESDAFSQNYRFLESPDNLFDCVRGSYSSQIQQAGIKNNGLACQFKGGQGGSQILFRISVTVMQIYIHNSKFALDELGDGGQRIKVLFGEIFRVESNRE